MEPPQQGGAAAERSRPRQAFLRVGAKKVLNRRDLLAASGLEIGLLFSGFSAELWGPPTATLPPQCATCSAYLSKYGAASNTGQWKCAMCGKDNFSNDLQSSGWDAAPALRSKVMEYLAPPPLGGMAPPVSRMVVFLVDLTVPPKEMEHQVAAVCSAVATLADSAAVGVVGFGSALSAFELPLLVRGVLRAPLFRGAHDWLPDELAALTRAASTYIASVAALRPHLAALRAALLGSACATRVGRAVGAAVSLATALLASAGPLPSHLLLLTGGAPSHGPGALLLHDRAAALDFYRAAAAAAARQGTVIDVFCCGLRRFDVSALQVLSEATGGTLLLSPAFSAPVDASLARALHRFSGTHGTLTLRLSHPLRVHHLLGPVGAPQTREKGECVVQEVALRAVAGAQAVTVLCELRDDVLASQLFVQAVAAFELPSGQRLTRVVTQRLPVTGNRAAFLDAVDAPAQALLLAKRLVAAARARPQPDAMLPELDRRLRLLLAFAGAAPHALPPALQPLPRLLFLARRGPLLSAVLQHEDDIDALRVLFLQAAYAPALRLLQPELFVAAESAAGAVTFEPAPLEDLMLQSDVVLLLDRHTDVFVWTGRTVLPPVAARLHAACAARAAEGADFAQRFPAPHVQSFAEGSSMARWLLCALVPSHKDPRDAHLAAVPRLAALEPAAYAQLVSKFHHTDDLSYLQYCAQLAKGGP